MSSLVIIVYMSHSLAMQGTVAAQLHALVEVVFKMYSYIC